MNTRAQGHSLLYSRPGYHLLLFCLAGQALFNLTHSTWSFSQDTSKRQGKDCSVCKAFHEETIEKHSRKLSSIYFCLSINQNC